MHVVLPVFIKQNKHVKQNYSNFYLVPASAHNPCKFVTVKLESNIDLINIISEVNALLPQLSGFISQFNNIVAETNINVITDSSGDMSIDVPNTMSDVDADNISKRIGIVDRLINSQGSKISHLLEKGLSIEEKLRVDDPNYSSQLMDKVKELKRLNASYKH
jgi:hypothetical protein